MIKYKLSVYLTKNCGDDALVHEGEICGEIGKSELLQHLGCCGDTFISKQDMSFATCVEQFHLATETTRTFEIEVEQEISEEECSTTRIKVRAERIYSYG